MDWRLSERFLLRPREQTTVAVAALVLAGVWATGWMLRGEMKPWEADAKPVRFVVDINEASWPELAALPRIGETLAKRIVANRERNGHFGSVADLERVHGIGPRTVNLLAPYAAVTARPTKRDAIRPQGTSE